MGITDWLTSVLGKVSTPRGEARSMTDLSSSYSVRVNGGLQSPNVNFSYTGPDWFGPLPPLKPIAPPQVAGRQWDFIPGYNLTIEPRPYEPISFPVLRGIADAYDPLRLVIERRKDQMARLPWTIRTKHENTKKKRPTMADMPKATRERIEDITHFLKHPDRQLPFRVWFRALLEDHFVIDAPSLFCRRNQGGELIELRLMDGALIKRIIDDWGRTPEPISWDGNPVMWNGETVTAENFAALGFRLLPGSAVAYQLPRGVPVPDTVLLPPAYQQVLKGMPAVDYTTWDMLYRPHNLRPNRVYGLSQVEQVVTTVNIALRRAFSQLEYYREGNVPEGIFGLPESWRPDDAAKFQDYWDSLFRGNLSNRRTMKFVPAGSKSSYVPFKEPPLKNEFDEWLARIICFAFSYPPTAFVQLNNRSIAEQHDKTGEEEGLESTKQWATELFNHILDHEFDSPDLEFAYTEEDDVDQAKQAEILTSYAEDGGITLNELRDRIGEEPSVDPAADQLMVKTAVGYVPIGANTLEAKVEATKAMQALVPKPEPAPTPAQGDKMPGKTPVQQEDELVGKRAPKKIPVYLIRHGKTKMNNTEDASADRIRAWKDVPLTDEGREDAEATAKQLAKNGDIEVIVSSDLSRAAETAEIVGDAVDVKPTKTKKLRPWDLGELTGTSTKTAIPKIEKYVRETPDKAVPKGESFNSFRARAFAGVYEAIQAADGKQLAIVTHHRVERLLQSWIKGGQKANGDIDIDEFLSKGEPPAHAELLKIDVAALESVHGHLKEAG